MAQVCGCILDPDVLCDANSDDGDCGECSMPCMSLMHQSAREEAGLD